MSAIDNAFDYTEPSDAIHPDHETSRDEDNSRARFRAFRREWIPSIKVIIASAADIFGDWIFFIRTRDGEGLDRFENPLWFFCVISSVLGAFTLISIIMDKFTFFVNNRSKYKARCLSWIKTLMGLEMILEDIPQLVLTVMVLNARNGGRWSPVAVFNATTSGFNFIFNILDMLMPLEEEHKDEQKEDKKKAVIKVNRPLKQNRSRRVKIVPNRDKQVTSRGFNVLVDFKSQKEKEHLPVPRTIGYSFEEKMLESNSIESIALSSREQDEEGFASTSLISYDQGVDQDAERRSSMSAEIVAKQNAITYDVYKKTHDEIKHERTEQKLIINRTDSIGSISGPSSKQILQSFSAGSVDICHVIRSERPPMIPLRMEVRSDGFETVRTKRKTIKKCIENFHSDGTQNE